ncbi:MAG: group III truncated hemoglobin [Saprospiraceae bacterium]|nr:group III truncated hemoglobin [Saprospiraceae bacterium]MBK7811508.1 group III truncated hemoglobin [Saprospiraceae bacterium]MBK9631249.1 group III truncated hemoglobin [Saprospiraceae bacterium]
MIQTDISTKEDIQTLVDTFYDKAKTHPLLGPIFNKIIGDHWDQHLPKMYSFWASILLGEQSYQGNPMIKHIELSKKVQLTEKEFDAWLLLFSTTVDELFIGEKANEAKLRANGIAGLMLNKIQSS